MTRLQRTYVNVDDFARAARRRLPRIFADYIDGGAFSETTLKRNLADFDRLQLRQKALHQLTEPDLSLDLFGKRRTLPFGPAPVGFLGLFRRAGDVALAKAAARSNVPFVLSTFSINGLETIANATGVAPDFQLYLDCDPEINSFYLEQCRAAGVETIFLTVDTAVTALRERDMRNGFLAVDRIGPRLAWQFAQRPAWAVDMLRGGMPAVELVRERPEFGRNALAQAGNLSRRLDRNLTWDTVRRVRNEWQGRLVIKGIANPEDARRAKEEGLSGIVLSNHGGRQLDHATSTISQVASLRAEIGSEMVLYVDSGFRRGSDIVKALALGADFILLGRPFAWAVAAAGEWGADKLFGLLKTEIEITLQLMGLSNLKDLRKSGQSVVMHQSGRDA